MFFLFERNKKNNLIYKNSLVTPLKLIKAGALSE